LPLGQPPDVRLRIFRQDGVLQRTLLDETAALSEALATYFRSVLDSAADTADTLHRQARIRHFHAGGTADQLARAADLYRAAIARDPGRIAAHVGLATVLQHGLDDPASAEAAYEAALAAGAPRGLIQPRMAECRRARGDLDAAIRLLQEAVETPPLPENYHARVEELANYFLERAESAGD
ncbi:MAG: hypothetical protein OER88_09360, partial [Planctomycetota bacterium]|nr:hypothetical protein [Planctomycetota bacterium]